MRGATLLAAVEHHEGAGPLRVADREIAEGPLKARGSVVEGASRAGVVGQVAARGERRIRIGRARAVMARGHDAAIAERETARAPLHVSITRGVPRDGLATRAGLRRASAQMEIEELVRIHGAAAARALDPQDLHEGVLG